MKARLAQLDARLDPGPYFAGAEFSIVDCAFGPVLRYFDVFEAIEDFGFFGDVPGVSTQRRALAVRLSVRDAVTNDYPQRLLTFRRGRESVLAALVPTAAAA